MRPQQIVILDLNSISCPMENCGQLGRLIQASRPQVRVDIQSTLFPSTALDLTPALVIVRLSLVGFSLALLGSIRTKWGQIPLLGLICPGCAVQTSAFQPVLREFDDFLCCPFRETELVARISRLVEWDDNVCALARAHTIKAKFHLESLVGDSECFLQVIEKIPRIAQSDATVLISGETGTGKELFARAIHYTSPRQAKPFVPVNCGALPDHLFENELFGHAKGAFTDASSAEHGLLGLTEGGTLFLDEIDTLSPSAQIKLLRFLQDREYRPLGSGRTLVADVRIIAASNADLEASRTTNVFREDLYHRLHVLDLSIPPLRERVDDIAFLAKHFLAKYGDQHALGTVHLAPGALRKLISYPWPGNVRELESLIQRALVLTSTSILQAADIDLPSICQSRQSADTSLREAKTRAIEQCEFTYLTKVLAVHQGNVSRAAKAAGKERRAFQRLLRKHGLERRPFLSRTEPSCS
jgi:DNA-binding NtrC family response regulator